MVLALHNRNSFQNQLQNDTSLEENPENEGSVRRRSPKWQAMHGDNSIPHLRAPKLTQIEQNIYI